MSTKKTPATRKTTNVDPKAFPTKPGAKRSPGRPHKAETKTRIVTMTEDAKADSAPLPQSVKKLAAAKAKMPAKVKKPSVNIAQLERSLKEARVALSEETKGKEELLADLQQKTEEIRRLNRTITRLNEVIADYKAKEVKPIRGRFGWFRRSK